MLYLALLIPSAQQARALPVECTWFIVFLAIVCLVVFVASWTKSK